MPSPEDLKGKILIKNKKIPPGKDDKFEDDSESEEEENEQDTIDGWRVCQEGKSSSQLA